MIYTKEAILSLLAQHQTTFQERFSVSKIGLFGSYATDSADENSDLDFYVEFHQKSFKNVAGLWNYLEKLFDKKVDLIVQNPTMRDALKQSIKKEVVYG